MNRVQQLNRYRKINELKRQQEIYRKLLETQKLKLTWPKNFVKKSSKQIILKFLKEHEHL